MCSSCCIASACSICLGTQGRPAVNVNDIQSLLWPFIPLLHLMRQYPLLPPGDDRHEFGGCLPVPVMAASVTAYSGCFLGRTGVALGVLKAASSIRGSLADSGLGESGLGCSSSCLRSASPVIEETSQHAASLMRCPLVKSSLESSNLSRLLEPCTMYSSSGIKLLL